jgi:predicted ArsR family transcriptional regulator
MVSTKAEILALLKRNGGHSISELAGALHLATITVRQHVTHLERDGLIVREHRQPGTRGQHVFRLTAKAHAAAFPRRSDRLVELLVREIGFLDGQELTGLDSREKTLLIVRRLAQRVAEEYAPLLQGWPLQERVVFVTEVMHADGGFAEWATTGKGAFEIRDFNCLFHRLLEQEAAGDVCEWHRSFLSNVLGADVRVNPCPDASTRCCRYIIELAREPVFATARMETA